MFSKRLTYVTLYISYISFKDFLNKTSITLLLLLIFWEEDHKLAIVVNSHFDVSLINPEQVSCCLSLGLSWKTISDQKKKYQYPPDHFPIFPYPNSKAWACPKPKKLMLYYLVFFLFFQQTQITIMAWCSQV